MAKALAALLEARGGALGWPRDVGAIRGEVAQPWVGCQNREHFFRVGLPVGRHAQDALRA